MKFFSPSFFPVFILFLFFRSLSPRSISFLVRSLSNPNQTKQKLKNQTQTQNQNGKKLETKKKQVPQYIPFPRGQADDRMINQLRNLFSREWLAVFKWRDFVMAVSWLALLLVMKEAGKRSRKLVFLKALGPLTVTGISIAVTAGLHLNCPSGSKEFNPRCVRVVGKVPKGLPHETATWWFPMSNVGAKVGLALLVCAIDVLESVSIAKALAYKNKYELAATQELTGLGLANIVGSAFQCYTTTGSFSRSAIMVRRRRSS